MTIGGFAAIGSAIVAVVIGFTGGDVAPAFVIGASVVIGVTILAGRMTLRASLHSLSAAAIALVLLTVAGRGVLTRLAGVLPTIGAAHVAPVQLVAIALAGGGIAMATNNLPAAVLGSVWLVGAPASAVIAFLIGTNLLALATPHGSVATILCRSAARHAGLESSPRAYMASTLRYAAASGLAACLTLLLVG